MSIDVKNNTSVNSTYMGEVQGTTSASNTVNANVSASGSMPKANTTYSNPLNETPSLEEPDIKYQSMGMDTLRALSTDAIMSMLNMEERKDAVNSGLATIEARRQERADYNADRIEKLQEQADKIKSKGILDKIKEVFSYIALALSAVFAIGSFVVGCMSANPALIVGSIFTMFTVADQITSAASDGKLSIANEIVKCAEKNGSDTKAAAIAAQVMNMVIGLTGAILTGVGAGKMIQTCNNIGKAASNIMLGSSIVEGSTQVVQGSMNIGSSAYDYQISELKAQQKELEAILARIQAASDMDTSQIEKILEKSQNMADGVKQIIDDCNQTLGATLAVAPGMA